MVVVSQATCEMGVMMLNSDLLDTSELFSVAGRIKIGMQIVSNNLWRELKDLLQMRNRLLEGIEDFGIFQITNMLA